MSDDRSTNGSDSEHRSSSADSNDSTQNESAENQSTVIGRRKYLQFAGATAASASILSNLGTVAAAPYDTITVPAGTQATPSNYPELSVDSGEVLENVLIDVTANGASAIIDASGSDWVIRNVGFKGRCDGNPDYSSAKCIRARTDPGSTGFIARVYLGDGGTSNGYVGMFVNPRHAGDLTIRRCNVQDFANNGIYGSAPGQSNGNGGDVRIKDCYAKNNNVAQYRLGTTGSFVRDSIAHVDSDVGSFGGAENARGVWIREGGEVDITGSDVLLEHPDASYCFWEDGEGLARIENSELQYRNGAEGYFKPGGNYQTNNNDQTPNVSMPDTVPSSAVDAANN